MTDIRDLVERQARWQRGRAALPWPEKIRLIEMIHESIKALRAGARTGSERPTGEAENPSVRS